MEPFTMVAPTASADGYGYSAEALILAATKAHGADINLVGHDWADERYTDPSLLDLKVPEGIIGTRDVVVVYFMPYALARFRSRTTLCMTMWESDRLPDTWARLMSELADGIIVPCEHCRTVVQERVDRPVRVAPFGTDTDLFTVADRDRWEGEPFRFLMSGLLHYRKGVDIALRAFREEFDENENARLILKTRRNFLDAGDEWRTLEDDRVHVLDADFTRDQMVKLYQGVDCLLAPSRGEGSGLTPRDAMSTGLPVILTDWGGLAEIADERYAFPLSIDGLELAPAENSSYGAGVTGGGDIGHFASPSVEHLRELMRSAFEDRDEARARGLAAADWMRREWTWTTCAAKWLTAVEALSTPTLRAAA